MGNSFFKNGDKVYAENLNDGVLVGNCFDVAVTVSLPSDTGDAFPNSGTVGKAKVCDVSITPNSNLSIGSTISNSSGSSQVYRLTVYPDFNRFGGFKSISLDADSGVTFYIANKGGTSPIVNNLDYTDLGSVPELKVLKEYDIVVTLPTGKSVSGLSFVLQSGSADVTGTISQSNVTGLTTSLNSKVNNSDIVDNLTTNDATKVLSAKQGKALNDGKSDVGHTHDDRYYTETEVGTWQLITTSNDEITMYVNTTLRLVDFKIYVTNKNMSTANTLYNIGGLSHGNEAYAPKFLIPLPTTNPTILAIMNTDGSVQASTTSAGTKNINAHGFWHY